MLSTKNILLCLVLAVGAVSVAYAGSINIEDGLWVASWNLDGPILYVAITARTNGYVGFGVGDHPNMTRADIYISGVNSTDNSDYSFDMHGVGNEMPVLDEQSNYVLLETDENATHTFVTFLRDLDTTDIDGDVQITDTVQHVLWSVGQNDSLEHHIARGSFEVNLMAPEP